MKAKTLLTVLCLSLGCLTACDDNEEPVENAAPIADAGDDQNVIIDDEVTLDGSQSSDADEDPLTYVWTLASVPDGSAASLDDATAEAPTFTADLAGDYVIELVVNDGMDDSDPDSVTVTAAAAP